MSRNYSEGSGKAQMALSEISLFSVFTIRIPNVVKPQYIINCTMGLSGVQERNLPQIFCTLRNQKISGVQKLEW